MALTRIESHPHAVARPSALRLLQEGRDQSEQELRKRQQQVYQTSEEYREYQKRLKEEAKLYR